MVMKMTIPKSNSLRADYDDNSRKFGFVELKFALVLVVRRRYPESVVTARSTQHKTQTIHDDGVLLESCSHSPGSHCIPCGLNSRGVTCKCLAAGHTKTNLMQIEQ